MTRRQKIGLALLLLSLTAAAGCAVVGAVFTRVTLHVPRLVGKAPGDSIEIKARDGAKLRASWFGPSSDHGCVAILHGIGDSRMSSAGFAQVFTQRGFAVLAPDSRAHGESSGDVVTYGLLEKYDVLDWARWMRQRGCKKVYGLGESLGAAILIQAAAEEPAFAAIVSEGAYADLQDAAEHRFANLLGSTATRMVITVGKLYARIAYGLDLGSASPLEAIRKVKTPILFIHGLNDDETPPEHSRRLAANAANTDLWLVPGVGHASAYSASPSAYTRRVFGWFEKN